MKLSIRLFAILMMLGLSSCNKEDEVLGEVQEQKEAQSEKDYETAVVSPNYTSVDWNSTEVYDCDPENGTFTFSKTNETNSIVPGTVLAIDVDTMGYVVVVTDVVKNDDRVSIKSKQGSLCDIFANYDFILSSMEGDVLTRSMGKDVYNPTKILVDGKEITTRSNTRSTTLTEHIWDWGDSYDGEVLYSSTNTKVYLKEANYSASLDLNLNLSFGQRSKIATISEAYNQYRSQALWINAIVMGNLSSNFVIQTDVKGKTTIQENEDDLWKHNLFKPIRMKFIVQGVPVYITLSADLFRGASLEAEGSLSVYTGFHSNAEGSLGFEWSQSNGISPIRSFDMSNNFVYPTIEGKGKIIGKTWLYPRLHITLYELAGPSFDIKPYLGCEVEGGFREQALTSSEDYCAWQLRTFAGLDVAAGLSLMFMNYETKHFDTGTLHITEQNLYESPTGIEFYKSQYETVNKGVKNNICFKVYDTNYLLNQNIETPLPQIVKFEGNGTLSSKYGIAKNGIVSVDWTPTESKDILKATLYNINGNIIKFATFGTGKSEEPSEGKIVDLGLSVKWAGWNIGASSPEEFGDYYSWGEIETKSDYSLANYKYFKDRPDRNYITESQFTNIGYNISGTQYDVAHVKWGGKWRMPTIDELKELYYCERKWIQYKGICGELIIGPNGNSIFLPQAGRYTVDNSWRNTHFDDEACAYWSASHPYGYWGGAYMYGNSEKYHVAWFTEVRCAGLSVRAVTDE